MTKKILTGWAHGLLGWVLCFLVSPFALAVAVFVPGSSDVKLFAWCLLVLAGAFAAGFPRWVRGGSVWLANRLLGSGLPAPARRDWPRTGAWLALTTGLGSTLMGLTGLFLLLAVGPVWIWLAGQPDPGYAIMGWKVEGAWNAVVGLFFLALAVAVTAGSTLLFRRLAPVLLGPTAAEKLAVIEEERAVLAHRNRLARELHDSIGHTLTTATIQAAVAGRAVGSDPELARRAMQSIEESSRLALEDLDHVLGVLRDDPAGRAPARGLPDVPELISRIRQAGAVVADELPGAGTRIPVAVSREAYRIVQEGLTNALRHGASPISVRVSAVPGALEIEIHNPVPGEVAAVPSGRGLTGLAERAQVLGGTLTSGPVPDGWLLHARLPR
ncbi:sensor histidine kinase [Longispora albida]|uniref:sensor histidine kinase n=1 Tax=Longispora albida TaxID=203523 RepID=UPI0003649D58|nr:histidine kinase [Longispora albida]